MALKVNVNKNVTMQQTTYIMYMMLGSYYKKCTCKTKTLENQLFLYYKEMPYGKQEKKEEAIIHDLDKLLKHYLDEMASQEAFVSIRRLADCYKLYFVSKGISFVVSVAQNGRYVIDVQSKSL